ncbi:MATH domain and coiled-coil domain-containing protein At3g58340-like [Raphanus sativus]|uniref:MATH domain and coiled-coil domain-containing protein At3g58340-like n=1 Tax=Raphanus sativus TaxID=3726 RepID=A0A6J0N6Q3_RAPSA|nr:MATH domain and coiled-coil domain-containing protein At3g58340-like [Raphanus sativus]
MVKKFDGKFTWVIENFSSLQSKKIYSDSFVIGGCRWRLVAYPRENDNNYLSMYLVSDDMSWYAAYKVRGNVYFNITMINQLSKKLSICEDSEHLYDVLSPFHRGFESWIPLSKLHAEDGGFLLNGELKIAVKVQVSDVSAEHRDASDDALVGVSGEIKKTTKLLRKTKETMDAKHGFQILPSQERFVTSMENQVGMKFVSVIQNFSFMNTEKCYSDPFAIRGFKWRLLAECDLLFLHLYMCINDCPPFPSAAIKVRLTIVNQLSEKLSILKESEHYFEEKSPTWGCAIPTQILAEDGGFLVNGDLKIVAEVIGVPDVSDESIPLRKLEVNGFHVLPSQVQSVRLIFERHPETAVGFRAKNQYLRTTFMNFLLSLIQTLYQPLQELSSEDLVEADIALTYLRDVGFKVDWLENKLDQLKARKEKERACEARVQEMEAQLHDLKHKFEIEKAELSVTRAPLSFNDFV